MTRINELLSMCPFCGKPPKIARAENSEWAAKSIERESHLAIANADNERLRAALQEIATIDVGAGNMVRPLSRTDFMVAFGTARQVACEALGSAAAGPDAPGLNAARNMGFMK